MSEEFISPFRLIDVQIIKMSYEVDLDRVEKVRNSENPIQFEVGFSVVRAEGDNSHDAALEVFFGMKTEIRPEKESGIKKAKPIATVAVQARGIVVGKFKDEISHEEKELLLRANGVSLLYGEVRGYVSTITSVSPIKRIELPGINPLAIAEDSLLSQEKNKEKGFGRQHAKRAYMGNTENV